MKRHLLNTLALVLWSCGALLAQSIPVTNGAAVCSDCVPAGWTVFGDSHPDLSNTKYCGSPNLAWKYELPAPPSGARTFATLFVNAAATEEIQTTMTGLVVDKHYTLFLHVLSAITASNSNYPTEAHAIFVSGAKSDEPQNAPNQAFLANFGNDKNVWKKIRVRFKATSSSAIIRFAGGSQVGSSGGGYLAIDIAQGALVTCNAGTNPVTLVANPDITYDCISTKVNLNSKVTSSTPNGAKLVWYAGIPNPNSDVNLIPNPDAFSLGDTIRPSVTVTAFYYDPVAECTNAPTSTATLKVTGPKEVALKDTVTDATCPENKGNITQLLDGFPPSGMSTVWYTNSNHSGSKITSPSSSSPGVYYAFYQSIGGCFNTNKSKARVRIKPNPCEVELTLRVNLQGVRKATSSNMSNDLQRQKLLPTMNPYGLGNQCDVINGYQFNYNNTGDVVDTSFFLGGVVDWVKVELRDSSNPKTILEQQALLLCADGLVRDVEGNLPKFFNQVKGTIIVVKHRNHLAIMSNQISFSIPSAYYDFTAGVNRAFNNPDNPAPPQMIKVGTTWCMIAGDINASQDYIIESGDVTKFKTEFKSGQNGVYKVSDLNLDGYPESADATLFNKNFKNQYRSIVKEF